MAEEVEMIEMVKVEVEMEFEWHRCDCFLTGAVCLAAIPRWLLTFRLWYRVYACTHARTSKVRPAYD